MGRSNPVDGRFHFAAIGGVATTCCRIVTAAQLSHLTLCILYDFATCGKVGITQAHLGTRRESEEFLRRILHEVVLLDVKLTCKFYFACACRRVIRMIGGVELFDLSFGVILDHDLQWTNTSIRRNAFFFSTSRTEKSNLPELTAACALRHHSLL